MPRVTVTQSAHYRLYENLTVTPSDAPGWRDTGISIPRGATVAVIAKGSFWDQGVSTAGKSKGKTLDQRLSEWTRYPYQILWFRVGKEGKKFPVYRGDNREKALNMNVFASAATDILYVWVNIKRFAARRAGSFAVTVIVWPQDQTDHLQEDCEELARPHPGDSQYSHLHCYLARSFVERGDYSKAEALLQWARSAPEPKAWDFFLSSQNENRLGRYELARSYGERALEIYRRDSNQEGQVLALTEVATALSAMRRRREAIGLTEQALTLAESLKEAGLASRCHLSLGGLYLAAGNPQEAEKHCKEALQFATGHSDRVGFVPGCHLCLGRAQLQLGQRQEAEASFRAGLTEASRGGYPEPSWHAHSLLGRLAEERGDSQDAFSHYAEAIKVIEGMRAQLSDSALKTTFMERKIDVYERMIRLLMKMQRDPEAFEYLERSKGRALLDMLREKAFSSRNREENALLVEERALARQIEQLTLDEERSDVEEAEETEDRPPDLGRLQLRRQAVLDKIQSLNAELASLLTTRPLKPGEVQALLDADTALLDYYVGRQGVLVFVVTKEKVIARPLLGEPERLFQLITTFRTDAVEEVYKSGLLLPGYRETLAEFNRILIHPLEGELAAKRHLVIIPHGVLHYVPFHALVLEDGRYLIESFTLSYLPSASVLSYVRGNNKGNHEALFAVGNPATGLSSLPEAEAEVREVSALFDKKLLLTGREATKPSVKRYAGQYDIVLLSTHGEMLESSPLKSNLRFTPSPSDDGKLTVNEIFDLDIKANLVTLSACETALARGEWRTFPQGDDLIGLSRAFIHAGTPSILASLWRVSDDSTVELMLDFYRNLRSMPKAEALRQAQLHLLGSSAASAGGTKTAKPSPSTPDRDTMPAEWAHPFYWAPFILVGDWK
ncbi:MAG TPA: CHAT domain-containing protein [Syntrophobacteria bacterium]|nr:CHAT domain-containing protein [Syntrophobacteria bacterium]